MYPRCFAIRLDYFFICSSVCMCVCAINSGSCVCYLAVILMRSETVFHWKIHHLQSQLYGDETHTQPHILTHKHSLTHAHNQHTFSFFTHIVSVSHTQKRDKKWEERCFFLIRLACTVLYFLYIDCSLLLSVFNTFLDIVANTHIHTPRGWVIESYGWASLTSHILEQGAELQVCVCVFPDHSNSEGQVKGIKGILHPRMTINTN